MFSIYTCMNVVLPDPAIPIHNIVVGCFSLGAELVSEEDI
jgi:hypothetical protein